MNNLIGIDVSKSTLDAYCSARSEHRQFGNNAAGLAAFSRWATARSPLVVFEASGADHRGLKLMLTHRGLTFGSVNPRQARRFAEAMGRVAKTDRLDAENLARTGSALQLKPTQTHSEALGDLRELLVFRRGLIEDRTAAKTRLKTARQKMLRVCSRRDGARSNGSWPGWTPPSKRLWHPILIWPTAWKYSLAFPAFRRRRQSHCLQT
ncbi:IS110 family transposase [Tropicibacter alexandrii]|uniref:IS110 family transposase n=1 Tax=Tropicibacter alexandrii TaxID=2267683 RepID=UPI000EF4A62E|nr:transposase [Tropicibacter alexandrii]